MKFVVIWSKFHGNFIPRGSINKPALAPKMQQEQAIVLTNDGIAYWQIYVSLSISVLNLIVIYSSLDANLLSTETLWTYFS